MNFLKTISKYLASVVKGKASKTCVSETRIFLATTTKSYTATQEQVSPEIIDEGLAEIESLIKEGVARHRGTLLNMFNCSSVSAFNTITSALAVMEELLNYNETDVSFQFRGLPRTIIKMGMHAGILCGAPGRFYGSSITTAEKVASLEYGAAVMFTSTVADLARPHLQGKWAIEKCGELIFKGVEHEWVYYKLVRSAKKTFISYRRDDGSKLARLIVSELKTHGVETLLDLDDFSSSHFDEQIFQQIDEAHNFIVILTPGSLDRCDQSGDWLRKEIAYALRQHKNIVPILEVGFKFPDRTSLPAEIEELPRHNAIPYSHEYFPAVTKRITDFLKTDDAG